MAQRALADAPPSFVMVGFSMGGYVAREIVRAAPDRVSGLVLIAAIGLIALPTGIFAGAMSEVMQRKRKPDEE